MYFDVSYNYFPKLDEYFTIDTLREYFYEKKCSAEKTIGMFVELSKDGFDVELRKQGFDPYLAKYIDTMAHSNFDRQLSVIDFKNIMIAYQNNFKVLDGSIIEKEMIETKGVTYGLYFLSQKL